MQTLSCIIIDDEPLAVKLLENFVERTPFLVLRRSFTDAVAGLNLLREEPADLVFLDIQMPDLNGMELARMVPGQTRIVFTTAFKEYAFESYEVSALDFLLKPIRYTKFLAAAEKARDWFSRTAPAQRQDAPLPQAGDTAAAPSPSAPSADYVFMKVDGEQRRVDIARILYVTGMRDYVMFFLEGERRPWITHLTMKAAEELLPADRFMRISRSCIVALRHVRSVDRNCCVHIGNEIVHVTEAYRESFERFLQSRSLQGGS